MIDKEILDNAPEGATHYSISSLSYYMICGWRMCVWLGEVWSVPISNELDVLIVGDVRSFVDIRRIADLEKQLEEAEECLTIAYMQGFSDGKDKNKRGDL